MEKLSAIDHEDIAKSLKETPTQQAIDKRLKKLQLLENYPKIVKLSAIY